MNKKNVFFLLLAVILFAPLLIHAQGAPDACATLKKLSDLMIKIGGTVVIIGWVITGILYLTAAGSPDKTGVAKKALIACIIGTIVIILAPVAYNFLNAALALNGGGGAC